LKREAASRPIWVGKGAVGQIGTKITVTRNTDELLVSHNLDSHDRRPSQRPSPNLEDRPLRAVVDEADTIAVQDDLVIEPGPFFRHFIG